MCDSRGGGGPRYAIYFVPEAHSDLYRCGSAILGYDCYLGKAVEFPEALKCDTFNWHELTNAPRRYGFHATLKAPFCLREPHTEAELIGAMLKFAQHREPVCNVSPSVRLLDGFVAITPFEPVPTLDALAAACTTSFDSYRAPMSTQERQRQMAAGLSERQAKNLDRWGYPYVQSDFRFHMTLTGTLQISRREAVLALLQHCIQHMGGHRPFAVDRLVVAKQDSSRDFFRVLSQMPLGGG